MAYALYLYLLIIIGLIMSVLVLCTHGAKQDDQLQSARGDNIIELQSSPANGIELIWLAGLLIGIFTYGFVQVRRNIE